MLSDLRFALMRLRRIVSTPVATIEFPFVMKAFSQGARLSLRNKLSECTGCLKCEQKCPVTCIKIDSQEYSLKETHPKTARGHSMENKVLGYTIDYSKCIQCGLCVDVCPTGSLTFEKNVVIPQERVDQFKVDMVRKPRSFSQGGNS